MAHIAGPRRGADDYALPARANAAARRAACRSSASRARSAIDLLLLGAADTGLAGGAWPWLAAALLGLAGGAGRGPLTTFSAVGAEGLAAAAGLGAAAAGLGAGLAVAAGLGLAAGPGAARLAAAGAATAAPAIGQETGGVVCEQASPSWQA